MRAEGASGPEWAGGPRLSPEGQGGARAVTSTWRAGPGVGGGLSSSTGVTLRAQGCAHSLVPLQFLHVATAERDRQRCPTRRWCPHAAQDGCEWGPTKNRKFTQNIMRVFCDYVLRCIECVAQDNSFSSSVAQRRRKVGHPRLYSKICVTPSLVHPRPQAAAEAPIITHLMTPRPLHAVL